MTTKLTHAQARQYLERRAQALGHEPWLATLESHLAQCAECRALAHRQAWLERWLRLARPRRPSPRLTLDAAQKVYDHWAWHRVWLHLLRAAQRLAPALSLVFTLTLAGWWLAAFPVTPSLNAPRPNAYTHRLIPNVPEFELHDDSPALTASAATAASENDVARANYR